MIPELGDLEQTIVLQFGGDAGPFSVARLRACGWMGDDILKLAGIDKNDVNVEIFYETFEGRQRMKCEIRLSSTFKLKEQMDDETRGMFAADVRELVKTGKPNARMRGR